LNTIYNMSGKGCGPALFTEKFFQTLGTFCLYYIPHHACSFNCKKSIAFGKEMRKIIMDEMPEFGVLLDDILKKPLLVFNDVSFCTFQGTKKKHRIEYETIIPELSHIDSETKELILKGDEIIEEDNVLSVYKNQELIGKLKKGLLLQFE
ncbi:MAG: hypothetical protein J7J87_04010, partial [Candidatus Diapherotrites archaeon]|nr:hypothetical protein [Candidatus Diapherotrites archaeon]